MNDKELLEGAAYWAMSFWRDQYEKDEVPHMKEGSYGLFQRYESLYKKLAGIETVA
jgi:hypothetical protein